MDIDNLIKSMRSESHLERRAWIAVVALAEMMYGQKDEQNSYPFGKGLDELPPSDIQREINELLNKVENKHI